MADESHDSERERSDDAPILAVAGHDGEPSTGGARTRHDAREANGQRFRSGLLVLLALVGSLVLLPGGTALAEAIIGDPIPTGRVPAVLVANPATNRVYTGNLAESSLTVIDGLTNTPAKSNIPIGSRTDGIAVSSITNRIYVSDFVAGTVTVVDGATQRVIGSPIKVGGGPQQMAVNTQTNRIYVASVNDNEADPNRGSTVSVIDGATNTTIGAAIIVGNTPRGIGVDASVNRIYVAAASDNAVTVIDGATNKVTGNPIPVGKNPEIIAVNPVTHRVYVVNSDSSTVTVIDSTTNAVVGAPIPVGSVPDGITVNPVLNLVYVANTGGNSVSIIDGATNTVVGSPITVLFPSLGVDVLPATGRLYSSDPINSRVYVIGVPLAIKASSAASADSVTATWNELFTPNGGDFVGLFEPGAPNTSPISRRFTNGTAAGGGGGLGDGSVDLSIPSGLVAGHTYEARLVSGRSGGGTLAEIQTVLIAAANDSYTSTPTGTLSVPAPGVLGNDSDPRSSALKATVVTGPAHGTLSLQPDGAFSYTPVPLFSGADSFTYRVSADGDLPSVATATITVTAPPIGANDVFAAASGITLSVPAPGVLANDVDADSPNLKAILVTNPAHGRLSLRPDGGFEYTPIADFSGVDSFAYRASDQSSLSEPVTVTLTVTVDACAPRPKVQTTPATGGGRLQVHVEATPLNTQQPNVLRTLHFGTLQNAKVTLDGQAVASDQSFTVPGSSSAVDFTVERVAPGQATTVPFTVLDGCGEWKTLVGGGTGAGF
jgi:YVTN family beta-propeller protein